MNATSLRNLGHTIALGLARRSHLALAACFALWAEAVAHHWFAAVVEGRVLPSRVHFAHVTFSLCLSPNMYTMGSRKAGPKNSPAFLLEMRDEGSRILPVWK
jgi:hypothetical protein